MSEPETPSPSAPREPRRVDPRLLEILVCPVTRATLSYDSQRQELISKAAKLAYPIRDGVPIMLPEEARPLGGVSEARVQIYCAYLHAPLGNSQCAPCSQNGAIRGAYGRPAHVPF